MLACRNLVAAVSTSLPLNTIRASGSIANLYRRFPSLSHGRSFVVRPARAFASAATGTQQITDLHVPLVSDVKSDSLPSLDVDDRQVSVRWNTKTQSKFHNIWLRDHCRCSRCFHPITKQRLLDTFNIPTQIKPLKVLSTLDGLQVTWDSLEHVSLYPWSWLQRNSYDPPIGRRAASTEKIPWGANIAKSPPAVTYNEVMAQDEVGLFKWLTNINQFGFSFVSDVPQTPEATEKLAERIGFIRETQYGRFWDFTSDLAKGDTAYTTMALGAHTDNTYYTDPSGLQLFHLLSHKSGSGGATLLVDGFYVASILKELYPESYDILSKVPIPAHAAGDATSIYRPSPPSGYPVLGHDSSTGELAQVRWNNDDRSVMNHLEPHLVEKWYEAIKTWNSGLKNQDSEYWVQLRPGTAVVLDNHRVLHGRSAFTGKRRMCGAYIGVDEYRSKLAVLQERFAPDTVLQVTSHLPEATMNGRNIWNQAL